MKLSFFHRKRYGYQVINVVGLAIGMAGVLLIGMFVVDELRVDRFHEHSDRIVRIGMEDHSRRHFSSPYPFASAIEAELGALVPVATRTSFRAEVPLGDAATRGRESANVLFVDPSFFEVFSFDVLRGDPAGAIARPEGLVLTRSTAQRLFGSTDPLGSTIEMGVRDFTLPMAPETPITYTIEAIVEDAPRRSTITFDILAPIQTVPGMGMVEHEWLAMPVSTYLLLSPGVSAQEVEERVRALTAPRLANLPFPAEPFVMPLTAIHLSDLHETSGLTGRARYLLALGFAALFILGIAGINYVNLATAYGLDRTREIGVRKTFGAGAHEIRLSLFREAAGLGFIALLLSFMIVFVLRPHFNDLAGAQLVLLEHTWTLAVLSMFVMGVAIVSVAYPALIMARVEPAKVLRGSRVGLAGGRKTLRRSLVLMQLTACGILLISAYVMISQFNYMTRVDLGFNADNVMLFDMENSAPMVSWETMRAAVAGHPDVETAAVASSFPGRMPISGMVPRGLLSSTSTLDPDEEIEFGSILVGEGFLETLGISPIVGGALEEMPSGVFINETAARTMGWSPVEALGKSFWREQEVIGVVPDFHFTSLHQRIPAMSISWSAMGSPSVVGVRLTSPHQANVTREIQELLLPFTLEGTAPAYSFLDERVQALYATERRMATLVGAFALLGVLIACLGLFGLAALTTRQRAKEIGIRRVLGATVTGMAAHLSREYVVLVAIALAIAAAPAYLLMSRWLETFAYQTDFTILPFVMTGLLMLLVSLSAVGYHVIRAATTDPQQTLRTE